MENQCVVTVNEANVRRKNRSPSAQRRQWDRAVSSWHPSLIRRGLGLIVTFRDSSAQSPFASTLGLLSRGSLASLSIAREINRALTRVLPLNAWMRARVPCRPMRTTSHHPWVPCRLFSKRGRLNCFGVESSLPVWISPPILGFVG